MVTAMVILFALVVLWGVGRGAGVTGSVTAGLIVTTIAIAVWSLLRSATT